MARMGKYLSLLLVVILAVSSLLMIKPIDAQSIPRPSVPKFTLRYVNNSYLVPETPYYQKDPYTGQQKFIGMEGGYLFKNYTIEITLRSQSFPSNINNTALQLYYNIRAKGLYEQNFSNLNLRSDDNIDFNYLPTQQNSEYTIISIPANTYTLGGTVQFQVRAIIGAYFYEPTPVESYPFGRSYLEYAASDWSNTQEITLTNMPSLASPNPTSTVPEIPITVSLVTVLFAVSLLLVIGKRKLTIINHYELFWSVSGADACYFSDFFFLCITQACISTPAKPMKEK
jgi:hypothetical protein